MLTFFIFPSVVFRINALMNFYFDLFGHVDGVLGELILSKLSALFKATLGDAVQGKDEPREKRDTDPRGVLAG